MKKTNRAKKAKERALQKIENNIERIYGDTVANKILSEARQCFVINDRLYAQNNKQLSKISNIREMTSILLEKWGKHIIESDKLIKIVNRNLQTFNIGLEVLDKNEAKKIIEQMKTIKQPRYLIDVAINYIEGGSMIYPAMSINPKIWKNVVGAMLFNIPKTEVLRCKESILLGDYLPFVNQFLQIQINELTTLGDIELIEDEIKTKQAEFEKMNNYINTKRRYDKREIDKKISNLYKQGLSTMEVKNRLKAMGITGYVYCALLKRRDEYKRQTRQDIEI